MPHVDLYVSIRDAGLCLKCVSWFLLPTGPCHQQRASERHMGAVVDEWEDFMTPFGKAMLLIS